MVYSLFVRQADAEQVEVADSALGLQRIERNVSPAHHRFHIQPGREYTFSQHVRLEIDLVVEIHNAQVGHAQVIDVGEGKGDFDIGVMPIFDDAVVFPADITAGFFHLQEEAIQTTLD